MAQAAKCEKPRITIEQEFIGSSFVFHGVSLGGENSTKFEILNLYKAPAPYKKGDIVAVYSSKGMDSLGFPQRIHTF